MSEKERMLELAGIENPVLITEALTPHEIQQTFNRFNKNLQRATLTDSFMDAVTVALPYAMKVTGKTLETLDEDDIQLFANMMIQKFGIDIKASDAKLKVNKSFAKKVKDKLKKVASKFKNKKNPESEYSLWTQGKLKGF